jgi:flavin-dependent thymidylate synthase
MFVTFDPPSVSLTDYTGIGMTDPAQYAAKVLIAAKETRLLRAPEDRPTPDEEQIQYIARTIPASWEFVHYTFLIKNVTRAFTHQFVRTRTASYAQESLRVVPVTGGPGWQFTLGPTLKDKPEAVRLIERQCEQIDATYRLLIESGVAIEDARGVLPTNIRTNIMMSCHLRTLTELVAKRSSERTQGEYREVLEMMVEAVKTVHPWTVAFFERDALRVLSELEAKAGRPSREWTKEDATVVMKLIDELRKAV